MERLRHRVKEALATDFTLNHANELIRRGTRALPEAAAGYVADKFPISGWLPRYRPKWLVNDIVAGLTIGLMLIPQGLSYAHIATVPVEYGLMSSWLPPAIYMIMGTAKDLSTGPTSLISLFTAEIIESMRGERWSPSDIASAVALVMGIYGLTVGLLKLGFLLEFISLPILSGFISAVATVIILHQLDSVLGEPGVHGGTAARIRGVFQQLPQANGYACVVSFTSILLLVALEQAGGRWGQRNKIIWFLSIARAFVTLVIFTGVGYAVNKPRGSPSNFLFKVAQVQADGQERPKFTDGELLSRVASHLPSIAVFIASAVEHTAIARAFGDRNNYVVDQSQEMAFYGIANIANSAFHGVGVSGAMSRSTVNSACQVKSPLSGVITTAVVLVSTFRLVGTLYWIPTATLAAVIITACWPLIQSPAVFYRYWRTSFADFVSSMIAFWVSLFVSTGIGVASSVGFNIIYVMLRQVFIPVSTISDWESKPETALDEACNAPSPLTSDIRAFRFNDWVFFANAYRLRTSIIEEIKTQHAPVNKDGENAAEERSWSIATERRIAKLRHHANITDASALPPLRLVVIDFQRTNYIDTTGCTHLEALVSDIRAHSGPGVQVCFAAMSDHVRQRFERAGWWIDPGPDAQDETGRGRPVVLSYLDVASAVYKTRKQRVGGTAARN